MGGNGDYGMGGSMDSQAASMGPGSRRRRRNISVEGEETGRGKGEPAAKSERFLTLGKKFNPFG